MKAGRASARVSRRDSTRSAPCVRPETRGRHQRGKRPLSPRRLPPKSVRFSCQKVCSFRLPLTRQDRRGETGRLRRHAQRTQPRRSALGGSTSQPARVVKRGAKKPARRVRGTHAATRRSGHTLNVTDFKRPSCNPVNTSTLQPLSLESCSRHKPGRAADSPTGRSCHALEPRARHRPRAVRCRDSLVNQPVRTRSPRPSTVCPKPVRKVGDNGGGTETEHYSKPLLISTLQQGRFGSPSRPACGAT